MLPDLAFAPDNAALSQHLDGANAARNGSDGLDSYGITAMNAASSSPGFATTATSRSRNMQSDGGSSLHPSITTTADRIPDCSPYLTMTSESWRRP